MSSVKFYTQPLAAIHASEFAGMWDAATDFLAQSARRTGGSPFVVDIGCGDGRMLARLREVGVPGWGCDISPAFVAAAKARGLDVVQADAASVAPPPATLIIALGEVLGYCVTSEEAAFERFVPIAAQCLHAGGCFIFDLISPDIAPSAGWRSDETWFVASRSLPTGHILEREIVSFVKGPEGWIREDETHRLMIFDPNRVIGLLESAGFGVMPLSGIGGVALLPGRIAFMAHKRPEGRNAGATKSSA